MIEIKTDEMYLERLIKIKRRRFNELLTSRSNAKSNNTK